MGFPGGSAVRKPPANAGDLGSVPGSGRPPGEGNDFPGGSAERKPPANAGDLGSVPGSGHGTPLQYSCLENPMDRGAWRATVPGVTKSQTRLTTAVVY